MGPDGFTTVSTVVQIYNGYSSNLVTYESSHSIVYSCGQNYRKKVTVQLTGGLQRLTGKELIPFSPDSEAIGVLTSSIRRDVFNLFTAATQPMRWFLEESQGSTGDAETDGWGRRIFYCDTVITRRSA